tara:strand:- start:2105 stop:2542 length:438 start_codon:yes stop_codon:yes gene_type:complete
MDFEQCMDTENYQRNIVNVLNSLPEYLSGVKLCGYQRITINVTKEGEDWFSYTSFNDAQGRIYDIQKGVHNPDISTSVDYHVLEDILDRKDELLSASDWQKKKIAAKYAFDFKMPMATKLKILGTMTKNGSNKYLINPVRNLFYS